MMKVLVILFKNNINSMEQLKQVLLQNKKTKFHFKSGIKNCHPSHIDKYDSHA